MQAKLLRVLQEKEFCRLGNNVPIKADFRVISACNQPLDALVESGAFRADLYHRLRVVQLEIPPLRERVEDIPPLLDHFLDKFAAAGRRKRLSEWAQARLTAYAWPGNVRELSNVVQSLVIMTPGDVIEEAAFPPWLLNGAQFQAAGNTATVNRYLQLPTLAEPAATFREYVQRAERAYIEHILSANKGDKSKTAAKMGIGRTTLYMKMKELGLMK